MPARNTVRYKVENGYYHVYNRGVDRRLLFKRKRDYRYFTSLLMSYCTPRVSGILPDQSQTWWRDKLEPGEISMVAYCLMPNHFHLLLHQQTFDGVTRFMRRVMTAYVRWFNTTYERCGALFESKYKSVWIDNSDYLMYVSRYIHRNPLGLLEVGPLKRLDEYEFSSYGEYIGLHHSGWLKNGIVMDMFGNDQVHPDQRKHLYQNFVESDMKELQFDLTDYLLDNI